MIFTRKFGAVLRGNATLLQILLATVFAWQLAFVPGFTQAPGLIIFLVCAVLIANANLVVFLVTFVVAKLLAMLLLPVSYMVGTWLLDGPLSGLFEGLVNGKVTAWFGFEYYAVTGGLMIGTLFGVGSGFVIARLLRSIRLRMAGLEANSERFHKFAGRWWVRMMSWLFIGSSKTKQSWQELNEPKRMGLPIRILGVACSALILGSVWVFQSWYSTPLVTDSVQGGLELANGATVDVGSAEISLSEGSLRIRKLAVADSAALDRDVFAADELVATIDTGELLRRRFVIDELRATNATSGGARQKPGVRFPSDDPEPEPVAEGTPTIEDYIKDYELWKDRFEQAQEWLEAIMGEEPVGESTPESREQQRQEQEADGLANVVARHLLREMPRFVIRKVDIEGIKMSVDGQEDLLDLRLRNITDAPSLIADALDVSLASQSDTMKVGLTRAVGTSDRLGFDFAMKQLSVDKLFSQLKIDGKPAVAGGTMDLTATGAFGDTPQGFSIDLPMNVAMNGATFTLGSMQPTKIEQLLLPVGLSGSLTDPAITLDDAALQNALVQAGQQELANFVQSQAGNLLGGALPVDLNQAPDKILDDAAKQAQKKLEDEAKKAAEDAAKKLLPGGLNGLLPGGGKKK